MLTIENFIVSLWILPVAIHVLIPLGMLALYSGGKLVTGIAGKKNVCIQAQPMSQKSY